MTNVALTPIEIGGVTIKNRIFRPPHQIHLCERGRVTDAFIAYHEARAEGGTGLIILEAAPTHWASAQAPDVLTIWDDEAIDGIARVAERLHQYDTKVFIQLLHSGCNGAPWDASPPWAPSSVTGYMPSGPAIEMTKGMIDEIVESYAAATRRAVAAGLDGVEVHAAHGYLPAQFLAPATNWRTDDYGGSFENRARFMMETMRAVRAAAPQAGFAIGSRTGPDVDEGLNLIADVERLLHMLEAEKLVDFHDLSLGDVCRSDLAAASMMRDAGYEVAYFDNIKSRLEKPVIITGRYRTVEEAGTSIRAGDADMVGMVRAQIADPHIVKKTMEGRVDEVRPCIACNQRCIGGIWIGDVGCAVNPGAGRELLWGDHLLKPAEQRKRVVIVGGGIAGMEAARVAAIRGHDVVLHEAQSDLGGTVRYVSKRAPKMAAFGDITFWMESEIRRLGVAVNTSSYVEMADLEGDNADVFLVATGSTPRMNAFQRHRPGHKVAGIDQSNVLSSIDLLDTPKDRLGKTAVVHDDEGHYEGIAACEYLIEAGLDVVYVTRHNSFAPLMDPPNRSLEGYARLFKTGRLKIRTRAMLDRIDGNSVVVYDPSFDPAPEVYPADTIVLIGYNASVNDLITGLREKGRNVIGIGDALSPRFVEHAIGEGHRAAAKI